MNKKNNLTKFSIPFSLLSIFLASCGKNTPITETTQLNLNVDPSTKYLTSTNAKTIVIPESGCVILNASANTNNNKTKLPFDNIQLVESSAPDLFQLNPTAQTLCHNNKLLSGQIDTAKLIVKKDHKISEAYNIEVAKIPLPSPSLNSITQNADNKVIYNFSVTIDNQKQPLNSKLYNIKFLTKNDRLFAFVPFDNPLKIYDYNNNQIGSIRHLKDGSTQFTFLNDYYFKITSAIGSIVIGYKNSETGNKYVIDNKNNTLTQTETDRYFTNEITERDRVISDKIEQLQQTFQEKIAAVTNLITNKFIELSNSIADSKETLTKLIEEKFAKLSQEFAKFQQQLTDLNIYIKQEITNFQDTLEQARSNIAALQQNFRDLTSKDAEINEKIRELEETLNKTKTLAETNESAIQNLSNNEIKQLKENADRLKLLIDNPQTGLTALIQKLTTAFETDTTKTTQIADLNAVVKNLQKNIDNLNNKIRDLAVSKIKFAAATLSLIKTSNADVTTLINKLNAVTPNTITQDLGSETDANSILGLLKKIIDNNTRIILNKEELDLVKNIQRTLTELSSIINPIT